MTTLTAVFAHPDDEAIACGGTLARYADAGARAVVVLATKGEAGEIAQPGLATTETLGEVREGEARRACEIIGAAALHFLGYRDGEVDRADAEEIIARLLAVFEADPPDVVITFGPDGFYGHPDHVRIGALTTDAFHRFRASHPAARLYHAAMPRELTRQVLTVVRAAGIEIPDLDLDGFGTPLAEITTAIDTSATAERKLEAIRAHASQMSGAVFFQAPREMVHEFFATEFFVRVWPAPDAPGIREHDLLG